MSKGKFLPAMIPSKAVRVYKRPTPKPLTLLQFAIFVLKGIRENAHVFILTSSGLFCFITLFIGATPQQTIQFVPVVDTVFINVNDAAPMLPASNNVDAPAYIAKWASVARKTQKMYGIPASISLAQGLIESRAGTSKLAVNNNNHFGMKCFSRVCKKGHCSNFTDDTHKDFFKKFSTAEESWKAHSTLISTGRYARLKKFGNNYRKWAYGLKSAGYATDRTYAEKLIGVIERYDLYKYDHH